MQFIVCKIFFLVNFKENEFTLLFLLQLESKQKATIPRLREKRKLH